MRTVSLRLLFIVIVCMAAIRPAHAQAGWTHADIGNVGASGGGSQSNGVWSVQGAGSDIWDTTDSFHFVYQPLTGDGQITARVDSLQNTSQYAKAGIMLRDGLGASAAHVLLDIVPSGNLEFMQRSTAGATTTFIQTAATPMPYWIRLVRAGAQITGLISSDGSTWVTVATTSASLSTTIEAGVAVTSHSYGQLTTATLEGVSVVQGWTQADVADVGAAGSGSQSNGVWTVQGAGSDIWGTADSFHFVYQPLIGDGQITTRVDSLQNTSQYAKAGIMLRDGPSAGAAHVILDIVPSGNLEFMQRSTAGATTTFIQTAATPMPYWIRLVRAGSQITALRSSDGSTWVTVASTTASMSTTIEAGLVVTSHSYGQLATATFEGTSVLAAPWTDSDVGNVVLTGNAVTSNGVFAVGGGGPAGVWGAADAFHFVDALLIGDGSIVARVTAMGNTDTFAKVGVMMRDGVSAGAANVILDIRPTNDVEFMQRSTGGGSTTFYATATAPPPYWLKLARVGSTITASVSPDGTTWSTVGTTTASGWTSTRVGLVVTSVNASQLDQATFDHVSVSGKAGSNDYDGDGRSDIAIYRPGDGTWYTLFSQSGSTTQRGISWGTSTDLPVPGDYDGDGRTDPAFYRPSTGEWWILKSSSNFTTSMMVTLGVRGDIPVPGDYDGDGKTDAAVFHTATATWTIRKSTTGTPTSTVFGTSSSIPVPGDYDGDGKTDLAWFDPTVSPSWTIQKSSGGTSTASLGVVGDIPVPGDYDGDGKADVAVYHPAATAQWQILKSSGGSLNISSGTTTDIPVVGDYDGDGKVDAVVFRPSTGQWLIATSSSNYVTTSSVTYGVATDIPVARTTQLVQPFIASVSPSSEVIGNTVTLTGLRFGSTPGVITFNGVEAQASSWSPSTITVRVPPGATTGPVVVTANAVDSNTAIFTLLTTPGITSTFCSTHWAGWGNLDPGVWYTWNWSAGDCTHGVPQADWVSIGQVQNLSGVQGLARCFTGYGQAYNDPSWTGSTEITLHCQYVAPPTQAQPSPGITICSHTANFAPGWQSYDWVSSECSHGLPSANEMPHWTGQNDYPMGMIDCDTNGHAWFYNPTGGNVNTTVKCAYIRLASPSTPHFTICTTPTLTAHPGWYNPDHQSNQYFWNGNDCTNGLPQMPQNQGGLVFGIGLASHGGWGLEGGNCLQSGAQHYNDPNTSGNTTGSMHCLYENNPTSPFINENFCGISGFPGSVVLPGDGGRWFFLVNALTGCSWTVNEWSDWLIPDQLTGTGGAVLTFGVNANNTNAERTGTIKFCGTNPIICGVYTVVQTPFFDGQQFCSGYCPGSGTLPPTSGPPPSGTIVYYHTDAIGSVRMVTDDNQQVVARYDYWPFGEQWTGSPSSSTTDPRMFAGEERDSSTNTNFDYLGARYYSNLFGGRFTTPDSSAFIDLTNPQSMNLYAYAFNNPLRFVDPTGQCPDPLPAGYFCTETIGSDSDSAEREKRAAEAWEMAQQFFLQSERNLNVQLAAAAQQRPKQQPDTWSLFRADATQLLRTVGSCAAEHYGLTAAAAGAGALGLPVPKAWLGVSSGLAGASDTTSLAGAIGFKLFGSAEPRIAARILGTTRVFGIVGRAAPFVSAGLLAWDAISIGYCTYQSTN